MIDHLRLAVSDYAKSKAFYWKVLAALDMELLADDTEPLLAGFGLSEGPWKGGEFWIEPGTPPTPRAHLAFRAESQEMVDEFYRLAIEAGATSYGAPGLRPHYEPGYYAAFVLDPDGNNLEAVYRPR